MEDDKFLFLNENVSIDNLEWDYSKINKKISDLRKKSIECLENLCYKDLGLTNNLSDLNIDDKHFEEMANRICSNGAVKGFIDLDKKDIIKIFKDCL